MPIRSPLDIYDFVEFMNSLLKVDPHFIHLLCNTRYPCNTKLRDHPTVQVATNTTLLEGEATVYGEQVTRCGFVGLMNGFFGAYDDGPKKGAGALAMDMRQGQITKFRVMENE